MPRLVPSLWFPDFALCFVQLPHFALTVWFYKNKEEMGKEICVQGGSRGMCLEVSLWGQVVAPWRSACG